VVPARIIEMRPSVLWVVGSEVVSARIVTNVHDFLLPIATYLEIVTAAWLQFSALAPVGLDLAGLLANGNVALSLRLSKCTTPPGSFWA